MSTVNDFLVLALTDAGILGDGQIATAGDIQNALTRVNYMIGQWNRKRWLVYNLTDVSVVTTGAESYTIGSGQEFDTPRPDRLEDGCFLRQLATGNSQQIDYPLQLIPSHEDYNRIRLKTMGTWPSTMFYDSNWPIGTIFAWPVPQANLYELHILVKHQLTAFTSLTQTINLPPEYEVALSYNLQVRLRVAYRMPADPVMIQLAKDSLNVIRGANVQVPTMKMPPSVVGAQRAYNVYSDGYQMPTQRIPLTGGMYQARSVIASAQRCVNLYPEMNEKDAPFPVTMQLTPGLTQLAESPGISNTVHRCAYTASNGQLFEVIGPNLYATASNWVRTFIGALDVVSTTITTPVSMSDNGLAVLIVDGTDQGYTLDLTDPTFGSFGTVNSGISGPTNPFYGADRVDYVDTFFVLNRPGTNQWYTSLSNVTFANLTGTISPDATYACFDPLDIASKTGNPDPIQAVIVMHREPWLIGTETTEVWYDAGNANFSFAELPGVFIEHGCCAKYSICKQDLNTYWLSQDRQGRCMVFTGNQYAAKRISTHAIEQQIQQYSNPTDAIGFTYQQLGHTFYVLTFPSADATWVYDVSEGLWHERAWMDSDGVEHRIRANDCAAAYGVVVVGDWETGILYSLDLNAFTDNGQPITRRRGFPTEEIGGQRVEWSRLTLDMDVGDISNTLVTNEPQVSLRYSNDRGKTWGNPVSYGIGATGQFNRSVLFTQLGQGRWRVFEVFWSIPGFTALNGGDAWFTPSET